MAQQSATVNVPPVVSRLCCAVLCCAVPLTGSLPAKLPLCFIYEYSHHVSHQLPEGCLCSFGEMSTKFRSACNNEDAFQGGERGR